MFRRKTKVTASEFSQQGDVSLVESSNERENQLSTIGETKETRLGESSEENLAVGTFAGFCKRYAARFVILLTVSVAITFLCPLLLNDEYSSPKISIPEMMGSRFSAFPMTAQDYYLRANFYHQLGDYQHAIGDLKNGLRIQPEHFGCNHLLGYLQIESGDFDGAIQTFNKLLTEQSPLEDVYYGLACAHELKGNPQTAEETLTNSFKHWTSERPFLQRAELFVRQGKIKEALADYDEALAITPDFSSKTKKIALLVHLGRVNDARKEIDRGHFTPEQLVTYFLDMPEVLHASGKVQSIIASLTNDINASKNGDTSPFWDTQEIVRRYDARAKLFDLMGEKDRARLDRQYLKALCSKEPEKAPFGSMPLLGKGYYLEQAGDFEQALDAYAEFGKTAESWARDYLPNRWRCLVLAGHEDMAIQEVKAFLARNPNHGAFVALALAELKEKNALATLSATDGALRFNLNDGDIYNLRADAYALLGDKANEADNRDIAKRLGCNGYYEQSSTHKWWQKYY